MEMKTTKHSVAVNETVFTQTLEQPLDISISLPDYCPDIISVLKCKVTPYISSKSINGQSVMIEGNAVTNLIYLTENGKIRSIEYIYPFSKSIDTKNDCTDMCVFVTAKSEYINCRVLTQRKADVHGSISVCVKVVCIKSADVIVDIDEAHMQFNRKNVNNTMQLGCNEKQLIIDEEFTLDNSKEAVVGIIRHDLHTAVKDCKIIGNKAVVKGEATLDVLYYSTNDKICRFCQTVPFSQIVETDGFGEECDCKAKLEVASQDLRVQNAGEDNSGFYLNARICVTVFSLCNNEIPVIVDAFSTDYETELTQNTINFEWIQQGICEKFLCKKNLEFADMTVQEVIDFRCEASVSDVQIQNKQLVVNGIVLICVVFTDQEGVPHYSERPVEFKYCCDIENEPEGFRCEPVIEALASSYTITGDNCIEARVELCVTADLYAVEQQLAVCDINVLENERKKTGSKGALVIYYAKCNESVWNIARKYNTSPSHIKHVNNLENDLLCEDVTLLIPCK